MSDFQTGYITSFTNAQLAHGVSETYLSNQADREQQLKNNKSYNALELYNTDKSIICYVDLDGLSSRRRILFPNSAMIFKPEERIHFNTILITNADAAATLAAGAVTGQASIMLDIPQQAQLVRSR